MNPNFFLPGTDHSLKVQARMEDKVRIKYLKSLFAFFEKFSRASIPFKVPAAPGSVDVLAGDSKYGEGVGHQGFH